MAKTPAPKAADEPPKKKRATAEEKAARDAALEAEKLKKQEEREKKKREKEEAEKQKAEQRAAKAEQKAADKAEKDQEKRQRAEEKDKKRREKEEEEAKKSRKQMKLTSMFGRPETTPKKEPATSKLDEAQPAGLTPKREVKETSLYESMFKPFFIFPHVHLANNGPVLDEETREAKAKILDEYISGERQHLATTFDPLEVLQIPYKIRRGRVYPSVKNIMADFKGFSSNALPDLTTESQNAQIRQTTEALKLVPMKSIKFREDVRPPYFGTISGLPTGVKSLQNLARKPISKTLPLNYEYDSEAEWQEEEGEDVDDLDDDEEEADPDEDMGDFLDDSEDAGPARIGFSGSMEPESTGPCWEDRKRKTEPKLYKFRMEIILGESRSAPPKQRLANVPVEPLEHRHSIDPFSTAYWKPPKPKATAGNESLAASGSTSTSATTAGASSSAQDARANAMAPPPAPSDAFQALNSAAGATGNKKSQQPLPPDMQQKLKDLVRAMPNLSKVGIIELFASNNASCLRGQIKTSFDALLEKSGRGWKVRGD